MSGGRAQLSQGLLWIRRLAAKLPAAPHIVVYGWPDSEGNTLHAAAQLATSLKASVFLLCQDRTETKRRLELLEPHIEGATRVIMVKKMSVRALWLVLTARVVLFTHGLFGNAPPGRKRVYVNLWHGHGPKKTATNAFEARIPSDLLIANTQAWGRQTAASLGLEPSALATIGNPRQDAMLFPPPPGSLARLGLSPARPYIVWMPTYRRVSNVVDREWADGRELSAHSGIAAALDELRAAVEASNVDFRIKLHPLDVDRLHAFRQWHISDADLLAAESSLYSLLGGASGLISDYSSVWVEYLTLDRPLLLFCPDAAEYDSGRGFKTPNMFEVAAKLVVSNRHDLDGFFTAVGLGKDWRAEARRRAVDALQLSPGGRTSPRLVAAIAQVAKQKKLRIE